MVKKGNTCSAVAQDGKKMAIGNAGMKSRNFQQVGSKSYQRMRSLRIKSTMQVKVYRTKGRGEIDD